MALWGIGEVLKRLRKRSGVSGRTKQHSFRHAFARAFLDAGGDLGTLSAIMGHSEVRTTQRSYAQFTTDELRAKHDKYS